jgi:hypothetical protein
VLFQKFLSRLSSNPTIGKAESLSKFDYTGAMDHWLKLTHNLIGCPETPMWTNTPILFNTVTITENGTSVSINPNTSASVKITVMSMLDNGQSYFQSKEGIGSETFSDVEAPYYITLTATNYIPYIKSPDDIYIQNYTFSNSAYISGVNIKMGSNVTTTKTQGPVIIQSGTSIVFKCSNLLEIKDGFELQSGASFEIN